MYSHFENSSEIHIKKEFSTCGEIRTAFELGKRYFTFNCMFCGEQFNELQEFSMHLDEKHLEDYADNMMDNISQNDYEDDCNNLPNNMESAYNDNINIKMEEANNDNEKYEPDPEGLLSSMMLDHEIFNPDLRPSVSFVEHIKFMFQKYILIYITAYICT